MKVNLRTVVFAVLAAGLLLLSASLDAQAKPAPNSVVSLAVRQAEFTGSQDVIIEVTIANPTRHTIRILKWLTPLDGVEEPLFVVKRDGQAVDYTGPLYKRPKPDASSYVVLKAGASLTREVNLGEFYDLSENGDYTVTYNESLASLGSNTVSFGLKDHKRPTPTPTATPTPDGNTSFRSCTVDQQAVLVDARTAAKTYASEAWNYLNANTNNATDSIRYKTWFGAYNSSRYSTVTTHFDAISDAMKNAPVTFDCKCKQPYYAYVYPNQPYEIYLCKVFWSAPMTGTDSKAGTLIHEMSHFDVVAGTDDFVYGQTGAMNLANTNPEQAVNNADSHEYFAENTPALP